MGEKGVRVLDFTGFSWKNQGGRVSESLKMKMGDNDKAPTVRKIYQNEKTWVNQKETQVLA